MKYSNIIGLKIADNGLRLAEVADLKTDYSNTN